MGEVLHGDPGPIESRYHGRSNVRVQVATPGAMPILRGTADLVGAMLAGHDQRGLLLRVAFGCAGGRHRSVVLAGELTHALIAAGIGAEVSHRDILRPVVRRSDRCVGGGA